MNENLQKWRRYCHEFSSPDSFIDFSFYTLISSALQRRVWTQSEAVALHPNIYTFLVGPPSVGKGLVLKQVSSILKHFRYKTSTSTEGPEAVAALANAAQIKKKYTANQLIPVAADTTTYEALLRCMVDSTRYLPYKKIVDGEELGGVYGHSSLCFCLEEVATLFRKYTDDLVTFFVKTYDCGDHTYDTKNQGTDVIKKCCLNFLGGTNPKFMRRVFNQDLFDEGLASRIFFIYEYRNRKNILRIPPFTDYQLAGHRDIVSHVKALTDLYGEVRFTDDALIYLTHWWLEINPVEKPNFSEKLQGYYGRKNIHIQKMAMAIHFADSTDMVVNLEECKEAMRVLDKVERRMHLALKFEGGNPLARVADKIEQYITNNGPQDKADLLLNFYEEVNNQQLMEILQYMISTGKIGCEKNRYKIREETAQ